MRARGWVLALDNTSFVRRGGLNISFHMMMSFTDATPFLGQFFRVKESLRSCVPEVFNSHKSKATQ